MSARSLGVLTVGAALAVAVAGCSASENGTAVPAAPNASAAPSAPVSTPSSTQSSVSSEPSSPSSPADGAVERYEDFLHAVGREDVATACEIAGPAAKEAEDEGFGPCEKTFPITFQMISAQQKQALRAATVDRSGITEDSPTKVEIPASAVKAAVKFTDSDLGDAVLQLQSGKWYVTAQ